VGDVIIIDDIVDAEMQDKIYNQVFSKDTKWTFSRTVFYDKHPEVMSQQKNSLMAFTMPLMNMDNGDYDNTYPLYHNVIKAAEQKLGWQVRHLLNARLQLQLPLMTEKDKVYGVPHIDAHRPQKYKIAVYYVNDVDGDTVLFKQTIHNSTPQDIKDGKLEVAQTISPKKGRLVIFDGDVYHSVGKPKTDMRCVVNYNFII
jgi:hypothetical protein